MSKIFCSIKSYIQPFEKELALRELYSLTGEEPQQDQDQEGKATFSIDSKMPIKNLSNRLTYWEAVRRDGSKPVFTLQARREATVNAVKNGEKLDTLQYRLPFTETIPLPNRRVLRYGSHGTHEYRGKFFPQLVRSLLNIAGARRKSLVLDSMCGSGTTPVEAILLGCNAIGMDLNPLSVLMSRAKCNILSVNPNQLIDDFYGLKTRLLDQTQNPAKNAVWFTNIPKKSQEYLTNWFSPQVLSDLDIITGCIQDIPNPICREFFLLSLSNIIRKVSWQKADDLRVRKEVRHDIDIDAIAEFISELNRSVNLVLAFLVENDGFKVGKARIIRGDACNANSILSKKAHRIDAIITSPPYATALPYLDTDRLSLYFLDLLSRPEHRRLDLDMIGNREITNGNRKEYLLEYKTRQGELPLDVIQLIDLIRSRNENGDVGFRRQNLPALLSKYFLNMKEVLKTFLVLLKEGGSACVVVGNNHTIAGGERVEIKTDYLLAQIGESIGLKLEDMIPMEMLSSRDIFRKNAGTGETIIFFRRP
jgi:site-specific DNA-methyltransferase (cytosine-N4-specific)